MTQDNMLGIVFIAIIFFAFVMLMSGGNEKKYAPEPDQDKKDELAREVLKGGNIEEIAERENLPPEDIDKWKDEYLEYILNLAENFGKTQNQIDLLTEDIEWFKSACKDHIGDDWEEKTDFENRARIKYK